MNYWLLPRMVAQRFLRKSIVGILLMVSGVMLLPFSDAATKLMSGRYSIPQIIWIRYFFPFVVVVLVTRWRHGPRCFVTDRPVLMIIRGLLWIGAAFFFATATKFVPLADAVAVVFFSSVVLILLSWILLRERVTTSRWIAVGLGLLSIMIIIRPGFGEFRPPILFALCAALLYGCYLFTNRHFGSGQPPLVIMSYQLLGPLLIITPVMPFIWVDLIATDFILLFTSSLVNIVGHLLIIRAFKHADASLLAPFVYFEIIMQTVLGLMLFGDFPDMWTWIGIALMVGVGVYISVKESGVQSK